ncbi:MAG: hypothetical protein S4CHLAM20_04760 [Chlamydiia bacterium]|nr:hypothetical protein [Chlamydiia bacterium]
MTSPPQAFTPLPEVVYKHQALLAIMTPDARAWDKIDPNDQRINFILRSKSGRIFLCILAVITIFPILILSFIKHPISINGSKILASYEEIKTIFSQAVNIDALTPPVITNQQPQQSNSTNNTTKLQTNAPMGLTNSLSLLTPLRNVCFLNSMIQIFVNTSLIDILEQAYNNLNLELASNSGKKPQHIVLVEQFIAITHELRLKNPNPAKAEKLTLTFYRAYCAHYKLQIGRQHDAMDVFRNLISILNSKEGIIGHQVESFFTDSENNLLEGFDKKQEFEFPLYVTKNYSTIDSLIKANFTSNPSSILHPVAEDGRRRTESITDYKVFEYHFNQLNDEKKSKHKRFFAKNPKSGRNNISEVNFEKQQIHSDARHRDVRPTLLRLFNKKMSKLKAEYINHLKAIGMHTSRLYTRTIPKSSQMFIVSTSARSQTITTLDENININGDAFTLVATLLHSGRVTSKGSGGHYVSYIKKNDQWWYCSDKTISRRQKPSGRYKTLFYQRVNNEDSMDSSSENA